MSGEHDSREPADRGLLARAAATLLLHRLRRDRGRDRAHPLEEDGGKGADRTPAQAVAERASGIAPPGRTARKPSDFTWTDWTQILKRTFAEIGSDNVSLVAAGVAFYAMLALFPAIAAGVMLYGFFYDPTSIESHLDALARFVPPDAFGLVRDQLEAITAESESTLGLASLFSLLLSLWSAKAGVSALMTGLNIVYDENDERGFIGALLVALALTAVLILVALVAFGAVVAAPVALEALPIGRIGEWAAQILRWPLGFAAVVFGIGLLYRFGPSRADAKFSWISWGAIVAGVIWLIGSALFSFYVANFGSYNETYGSLGAVVGLLMWFYLSAFIVLLGAELNAEMEHQTMVDTTTGPPAPMGARGAHVADTVPGD